MTEIMGTEIRGIAGIKRSGRTIRLAISISLRKRWPLKNKTSATLTNVKAWFYEPDKEGTLIQVDEQPISLNDIQPGTTATFKIPDAFCSFVRFTAGDNDTEEISEYYNFYNEKVTGEKQKSFQYSEGQCYCYMYNGIEGATWGRPGATRIYYDATFFQDGIEWRYQRLFNPQSQ